MRWISTFLRRNLNDANRQEWLAAALGDLPRGIRILDAGAGELRNKPLCAHLDYVSQDFCQYSGGDHAEGLHFKSWDTSKVDIVSDIAAIPLPDESFDAILCSEVIEHIPEPIMAIQEFSRLLKPGGVLILTAPFNSLVHFAPHYYFSGYSKYWYQFHLPKNGFQITDLSPNGDWFSLLRQEVKRMPGIARRHGNKRWLLSAVASGAFLVLESLARNSNSADELGCFGWHCVAVRTPIRDLPA